MATAKKTAGKDPRGALPAARAPASKQVAQHDHLGGEAARRRLADLDGPANMLPPKNDPNVTVRIPRRFRLQVHRADGSGTQTIEYQSGIDEMPKSHALHEYSIANGVEIVDAK